MESGGEGYNIQYHKTSSYWLSFCCSFSSNYLLHKTLLFCCCCTISSLMTSRDGMQTYHWTLWETNFVNNTESSLLFSFSYCCDLLFSLFWCEHNTKSLECDGKFLKLCSSCLVASLYVPCDPICIFLTQFNKFARPFLSFFLLVVSLPG